MLKALGATNLQISGVFFSQSAIIGVLGVIAGYGLGIFAVTYRNEFLQFMRRRPDGNFSPRPFMVSAICQQSLMPTTLR